MCYFKIDIASLFNWGRVGDPNADGWQKLCSAVCLVFEASHEPKISTDSVVMNFGLFSPSGYVAGT